MDGIEAAEAIRSQHDVPVVYLTAHSDAATLGRAKLTGPFGYILKPFEERELAIQIEMALYQHQADRQLRQQREWLRVTLTSIGDAVIATDATLRITFVNPVAESLTGWPADEAVGRPLTSVFRIINEQTGRPLEEPVTRALRESRVVELANHAAVVTKDGRTIPIEDSAAPILDASGQVIGAVLVFHDVTEKRRAEEALRKEHDELEKRVQERTSELSTAVQRLQAEIVQRRRLEETLRESETQVRFFASQCLTAQETERRRIASELHDSIAASLAAIRLRIERMANEGTQNLRSAESLQDIASSVAEINADVRRIMADLRPSILDDLGILAAINWFCREYEKTYSHISIEQHIGIEEHKVPDSLKTPIFRISQEAMNNISKHSQASLIKLSLQMEDDRILLTITDNGQGFDPDTVRRGLGLSSIRERAELSGGSSELKSAIGKGTMIRVSWPI